MPEKYYTPCNVGIYIGGYKVSDAFRVDWDARDSKTPLYGWADETYSAVTNGRKIVTGRLVINYKYPGYLSAAITEFTKGQNPINEAEIVKANDEFDQLRGKSSEERVKFLAQLAAKNYGDNRLASQASKSMISLPNHLGAATKDPFMSPNYDPNNMAKYSIEAYKQKNTFDILVTYGDILKEEHIEVTLKDAYIVGQSQTISASATGGGDVSSSGSPIYEIYSFFAKEIVERSVAPRDNSGSPASNVNTI